MINWNQMSMMRRISFVIIVIILWWMVISTVLNFTKGGM